MKKNNIYIRKNILFCLLLAVFLLPSLFLCPKYAYASPFFSLSTSSIEIEENRINLELYLVITSIGEIEKVLKSGASIEISCNTNLLKKNTLFLDSHVENLANVWLLRYDALTREFLLFHNSSLVQRNRAVQNLTNSILFPLSIDLNKNNLEVQSAYIIDVDLHLRHANIPTWIEKTLFFWDWNLISTRYSFDLTIPEERGFSKIGGENNAS